MKKILVVLIGLILFQAAGAQVNPTTNRISMDISTAAQNPAFNYDSCFKIADDIGVSSIGMFQNWTSIETSPGVFNMLLFDIANFYYPAHGMSVDLTISPISTNHLEVPSDLTSTAFDSPVMISRFKILLDSIKIHSPSLVLSSLVIGSEHDIYIGGNATLWNQYTTFYDSVGAYAKTLWPGLKIATELTHTGLKLYNSFAQTLNTNSDYIGVSYYPLNSDFTVKPYSSIFNDLDTVITLYPVKPICFYQYGYPTSTTCNSSEAQQAAFITQTFAYWDVLYDHILMIDFTWLHDLDTATVNYYSSYYGITDTVFLEYLRTLGFRTWNGNGTDKPALNELRCQSKSHFFNSLPFCMTAIEEWEENSFNVYPNPASSKLTLHFNKEQESPICIYNTLGVLMMQVDVSSHVELDVADFPSGFYYISGSGTTKKFIKE